MTPSEDQNSTVLSLESALPKPIGYYQERIYQIAKENYPGLISIAKFFIDRQRNQYDNQVTVEGVTGSGKSMLTFIMTHILHHMLKKTFDPGRQILFAPNEGELKRKMLGLKKHDVFWLDEAIRALDKHFWYNVDQIEMNQLVKTRRKNYNTIFYNIQRFKELTESFRNHNIQSRLYIINRFAVIHFVRDDDKDVEDPWHTKENLSIKYRNFKGLFRYQAIMTQHERLAKEIRLPNYMAHSDFFSMEDYPDLKEYWEKFTQYSNDKTKEALDRQASTKEAKTITRTDLRYRKMMEKIVKKYAKKGIKHNELNEMLGIKIPSTTYHRLLSYNIDIKPTPESPQD